MESDARMDETQEMKQDEGLIAFNIFLRHGFIRRRIALHGNCSETNGKAHDPSPAAIANLNDGEELKESTSSRQRRVPHRGAEPQGSIIESVFATPELFSTFSCSGSQQPGCYK